MRGLYQRKAWVLTAMVARREVLTDYCGDFVLFPMDEIMNYSINAGLRNFITRLK